MYFHMKTATFGPATCLNSPLTSSLTYTADSITNVHYTTMSSRRILIERLFYKKKILLGNCYEIHAP